MTAITCEINKIAYSFEVFFFYIFTNSLTILGDRVLIIYCAWLNIGSTELDSLC